MMDKRLTKLGIREKGLIMTRILTLTKDHMHHK